MARPEKHGLDYFPLDTDFFENEIIMAIYGEFGLEGEMVAVKLLCMIYRKGYFTLWQDLQKYKMLRSLPGVSPELLDRIVNRLVSWGFFDKDLFHSAEVLTSKEIQERYFKAIKRRVSAEDLPHLLIDVDKNKVSARKNPAKFGASTASSSASRNAGQKVSADINSPAMPTTKEVGLEEIPMAVRLPCRTKSQPHDFSRAGHIFAIHPNDAKYRVSDGFSAAGKLHLHTRLHTHHMPQIYIMQKRDTAASSHIPLRAIFFIAFYKAILNTRSATRTTYTPFANVPTVRLLPLYCNCPLAL